jgi:hypothetical protein
MMARVLKHGHLAKREHPDLKDVVLVDGDVVRFLCASVNDGIVLHNCPPYIRAWMAREGEQP